MVLMENSVCGSDLVKALWFHWRIGLVVFMENRVCGSDVGQAVWF